MPSAMRVQRNLSLIFVSTFPVMRPGRRGEPSGDVQRQSPGRPLAGTDLAISTWMKAGGVRGQREGTLQKNWGEVGVRGRFI